MSAAEELAEMRARWAERPRQGSTGWRPERPSWLPQTPELHRIFDHWHRLYFTGEVTWGRILQSHHLLWKEGIQPDVAEVVWSDDPYVVAHPEEIEAASRRYHTLREAPAREGPLQALDAFVKDEKRPAQVVRFPAPFCAGRVIWHTTVVVYPHQLPRRRLQDVWVPIVRDPEYVANTVTLLPSKFWGPPLLTRWARL